jgi:RNA polymerase sigma-70 factor, ECF subfamily
MWSPQQLLALPAGADQPVMGHCERAHGEERAGARRLDPAVLGDHVDRLYRAARGMCGSREEAEDLVQETFARVLQKPRFLRSDDDIGYLLRVLRNTFVSTRRSAARRPELLVQIDDLASLEDASSADPERELDRSELYHAIAALPDAFRDALIAIDVMGLSYREAGRALRVREATITTRLHRARQRVADMLAGESGITPAVQGAGAKAPAAGEHVAAGRS